MRREQWKSAQQNKLQWVWDKQNETEKNKQKKHVLIKTTRMHWIVVAQTHGYTCAIIHMMKCINKKNKKITAFNGALYFVERERESKIFWRHQRERDMH